MEIEKCLGIKQNFILYHMCSKNQKESLQKYYSMRIHVCWEHVLKKEIDFLKKCQIQILNSKSLVAQIRVSVEQEKIQAVSLKLCNIGSLRLLGVTKGKKRECQMRENMSKGKLEYYRVFNLLQCMYNDDPVGEEEEKGMKKAPEKQ